MFLSVKELEIKKVRFAVTFPPGEIAYDEGLRQMMPLEVEGSAELLPHTLGEIRIQGHLNVRMGTECDRCLEPAEFPIDSNFDLFYRPPVKADYGEEVEIDEGEAEIAFYEGGGLELKDVLREYVCSRCRRSGRHVSQPRRLEPAYRPNRHIALGVSEDSGFNTPKKQRSSSHSRSARLLRAGLQ